MSEFEHTTVILAPAWDVLRYLSEPRNLADFLPGVLAARWVDDDDGVAVTIKTDAGSTDLRAWMRVDTPARRLSWGLHEQRGSRRYSGSLEVDGGSNVSQVHVVLHIDNAGDGSSGHDALGQQIQHILGCLRHQIETLPTAARSARS